MSFYFHKPFTPYNLRAVIDSGRAMTVEEATDIVRRSLANLSDVSKADRKLAYAVLMNDWAEPHGLTLVEDGWWRMIGLSDPNGPRLLPGDRVLPMPARSGSSTDSRSPTCRSRTIWTSRPGRRWKAGRLAAHLSSLSSISAAGLSPTAASSSSGSPGKTGAPWSQR